MTVFGSRVGVLVSGTKNMIKTVTDHHFWISGFLDFWILGFLDFWISGFLDFRILGFLDFWISGFLDFRIFGFLDFWIFGFLDFRISGFLDFWPTLLTMQPSPEPILGLGMLPGGLKMSSVFSCLEL